jgi:hypothetical protein
MELATRVPQAGLRPEHTIRTSSRTYSFGGELNTLPREAEIRKAIEWAERGTPEGHGVFVQHILPMILIMDPDAEPPTSIESIPTLNLDLAHYLRRV